jgi:hypothetical protein
MLPATVIQAVVIDGFEVGSYSMNLLKIGSRGEPFHSIDNHSAFYQNQKFHQAHHNQLQRENRNLLILSCRSTSRIALT